MTELAQSMKGSKNFWTPKQRLIISKSEENSVVLVYVVIITILGFIPAQSEQFINPSEML